MIATSGGEREQHRARSHDNWWTWTNLSDYQLAPVAFIVFTL